MTYKEDSGALNFWFGVLVLVILAALFVGCRGVSLAGPTNSGSIPVRDGTPEIQALVDSSWDGLQSDLAASRFDGAPRDAPRSLHVVLVDPAGSQEPWLIPYPGGGTAFSYLEGDTIYLSRRFMEYRLPRQILRHEYAHAHCQAVFGHGCTVGGLNTSAAHVWAMPDGQDLWHVVWMGGR